MKLTQPAPITLLALGLLTSAFAQNTPTISGVSAIWWLGSGILSDGNTCSGYSGPCYYAQSQLTSDANGTPGTPTWSVYYSGSGSVSLSCNTCANPVVTAMSPSSGCAADVTLYVSYDGYPSAPFGMTIVAPSTTTLQSGYPTDSAASNGYLSVYIWNLTDTCGNSDPDLDGNETFGPWYNNISNDWGYPRGNAIYDTTSLWGDMIGAQGTGLTPPVENPQTPLSSTAVHYSTPWNLFIGSQTPGSGTSARADISQNYVDHGRHL
jgi:hypothetical protein